MADSPAATLADINKKIDMLAAQRDKAIVRAKALDESVELLNADKAELESRLNEALQQVEFLTLSHRLADSPQALAEARRKITGLIRKIDAAIALIKSDPGNI